ncbi:MAG: hypothetical protein WBG28_06480, partial [Desulfobulbales bacterium]
YVDIATGGEADNARKESHYATHRNNSLLYQLLDKVLLHRKIVMAQMISNIHDQPGALAPLFWSRKAILL